MRRILYLLMILIWLFLISLPLFAFSLAARNQFQWGTPESSHIRLFLIQERDAEGIGLEITRSVTTDPVCLATTVRYVMWAGSADDVAFCQCSDNESGYMLPAVPGTCRLE